MRMQTDRVSVSGWDLPLDRCEDHRIYVRTAEHARCCGSRVAEQQAGYRCAVTNWTEFYFMCGSAAAGLTGLMFIAVTFGARLITNEKLPYVEAFFSPISDHFMQVFILCAVALIPIAGAKTLGGAILITTVFRFAQLAGTYRLTKVAAGESEDIELSDWILGIYLPAAVYLLLVAAGAGYLIGSAAAPGVFAFALLCLVVVALRRAWEMLLWIATKID
jgi:hypothetical protein